MTSSSTDHDPEELELVEELVEEEVEEEVEVEEMAAVEMRLEDRILWWTCRP